MFKTEQKQANRRNKKGFGITLGNDFISVLALRQHYWQLSGLLNSKELCKNPVFWRKFFLSPLNISLLPYSTTSLLSQCCSCRLQIPKSDNHVLFLSLHSLELTFLYRLHCSQEREWSSPSSTNSVRPRHPIRVQYTSEHTTRQCLSNWTHQSLSLRLANSKDKAHR